MERRELLAAGVAALAGSLAGCADPLSGKAAAPVPVSAAAPALAAGPLHRLAFGSCIDHARPQPICA